MSLYSYFCAQCGLEDQDTIFLPIGHYNPRLTCPLDGGRMKRGASFAVRKSMPGHYNQSVGAYVTNERQFRDQLKIKSEEASERTGMNHNFIPVDLADAKSLGVTDEGRDETLKRWHDAKGADPNAV